MKYLFGQVWLWCLLSFLIGALVTWLIMRLMRKPKVEVTEERISGPAPKSTDRSTSEETKVTGGRRRGDNVAVGAVGGLAAGGTAATLADRETDITVGADSGIKADVEGGDRTVAMAPPKRADSALSMVDEDERTTALRSDTTDAPSLDIETSADNTPADETPTGRIPSLGGAGMLGVAGVGAAGTSADSGSNGMTGEADLDGLSADINAPDAGTPSVGTRAETATAAGGLTASDSAITAAGAGAVGSADAERMSGSLDVTAEPYGPGSAAPGAGGAAPSDEFTIKGNADSMLYHTSASPYYGRTKAEVWFKTESDARRAGFEPWHRNRSTGAQGLVGGASTWEPGPYRESAMPLADGSAPSDDFTIKGNVDSMLYHGPESSFYNVTRAEVWFRTEADAENAGFHPWNKVGDAKPNTLAGMGSGSGSGAAAAKQKATITPDSRFGVASAVPLAGGAAPSDEFTIKGNVDSMLYHGPESSFYNVTTAEVWFRTETDAEAAGFTAWNKVGDKTVGDKAAGAKSGAKHANGLVQTPPAGPHGPGSAEPKSDGSAPSDEYTVKGNADSMLYHTTESPYYPRTRAEVWFKAPADAERAGFTAWNARRPTVPHQPVAAEPSWESGPYEGSAKPKADGSAPSREFTVKGNEDSMLFHTTDSPYYSRTRAEVWFRNGSDAERAGFTAWNVRRTGDKPSRSS